MPALFRRGDTWAAFTVSDGTASEHTLEIGERNSSFAPLVGDLDDGERMIFHPDDQVSVGVAAIERRPGR